MKSDTPPIAGFRAAPQAPGLATFSRSARPDVNSAEERPLLPFVFTAPHSTGGFSAMTPRRKMAVRRVSYVRQVAARRSRSLDDAFDELEEWMVACPAMADQPTPAR